MLREYEYGGVHLLPQRMIGLRQDDEQVSEEVEVVHEFEGEHAADDRAAALNGEYRVERLIETEARIIDSNQSLLSRRVMLDDIFE